jgi:hypothetical protein
MLAAAAGWLYIVKGYISVKVRHAVPGALIYEAEVLGFKKVRVMVDPLRMKNMRIQDEIYNTGLEKAKFNNREINMIAISGGGANGAYAAGVLCGWTETGKRPQFDIVTGVSTGALIAPATFIGPSYDGVIKDIYTNISDADIMKQNLLNLVFGNKPSILDTQPLRHVLKRVITQQVINDVADAHAKGRRLYIATTNLDAKRLVVWDMGAIAARRNAQAVALFREVMLASASIPVAFPPVLFKVEANGKVYDEMHVDGSVATQVFGSLLLFSYPETKFKRTNVYVIRNGKIADMPAQVSMKAWDIAGSAFATLMTWQSYGDIYRFYTLARYGRIRFYFTCIPYYFDQPRSSEFDLAYMRKLFYRAYRIGSKGGHWYRQVGSEIAQTAPGK